MVQFREGTNFSRKVDDLKDKGTILIIDDEKPLLDILSQFLSDRGFEVDCAYDGNIAIEMLSAHEYDVALVDLKLPDIDGLELISHINKKHPGTKCIVMTAYASMESTIEALRLDAFDYVQKPFDLVKIAEIVDAAYGYTLMIRENAEIIKRLEKSNRKLEKSRSELSRRILKSNEELAAANQSLNNHVTRLKMLYQMGRDISSNENWSDALDRFLMALCKYIEAEGTALVMFSNEGHTLQVRTSYNLEGDFLTNAVSLLLKSQEKDLLQPEIFNLDGCREDRTFICLGMNAPWEDTVVPLLYRGKWVGFLLIKKHYASRNAYLLDYHFINTIQTILTEEVANAVNISRLRELKHFNETILDNINSGVIKTDRTGKVIFRNSRAREILGEEPAHGLNFNDIFKNPYGSKGLFEYLIGKEEKDSSLEGVLLVTGRDSLPVRVNSTKVRDDYRGSTIVSVFEDLTVQKAMEEELRRSDRLRSLGELSAGVAHEIRNPLTGIATTAQVLKEQLLGQTEKMKYLTVILDEIKRLDDIIRNLLNFARPVLPKPDELSLKSLLKNAIMLVSDEAGENGVKTRLEIAIDDDSCFMDSGQIKQVMLNVMMNGIQACEPGGELTVFLKKAVDPVFIRMEFLDTGSGISDDIADKLYDPFFTTRAAGTGLGLSITRKIVEIHGGHIFHESRKNKGTRFVIELPRRIVAASKSFETERVS